MILYASKTWYDGVISKKIKEKSVQKDLAKKIIKFENWIKNILNIFIRTALPFIVITGVYYLVSQFTSFDYSFTRGLCLNITIGVFIYLFIWFNVLWVWARRTYKLLNKEAWIEKKFFQHGDLFLFFLIPLAIITIPYRFIRDTNKIFFKDNDDNVNAISDEYQNRATLFHIPLIALILIFVDIVDNYGWYSSWNLIESIFFILIFFVLILKTIKKDILLIINEHKKIV